MKSVQYMRITAWSDREKDAANTQLLNLMDKALLLPGSFDYPFDSLVTMEIINSPDRQFRIITWDVPQSAGTNLYCGFIQSYNARKKKYDLFILKDKTVEITNPRTEVFTPNKWMGMLYFKIIKKKDSKLYTLLAWQGYSKQITRKVIDVLSFNAEGIPSFGKAIFENLPSDFKRAPKRMIFEYSAQVYMSLRYDKEKNMILFDHLEPTEGALIGQYQYYGPSFQVDGLNWENGKWSYVSNVQARNANTKEDKLFNDPQNPSYQLNKKAIYQSH